MLAFGGYFYWDDLILIGKAGTQGLLSPSYLFDDHDGHLMPAAFLVAGAIIRLAPLDWTGPAISLLLLQLLASLALLRALYVILGRRWVLLIPLTFAYAIVRFQMLNVRVIVRRTFLYAATTGVLLLLYALVIALANLVFASSKLSASPLFKASSI